jgi:hypothetical protein
MLVGVELGCYQHRAPPPPSPQPPGSEYIEISSPESYHIFLTLLFLSLLRHLLRYRRVVWVVGVIHDSPPEETN